MSIYFSKGAAASLESKHYKKNANGISKHEAAMPHGLPRFSQNTFPNEKPPTLFHPASPKLRATRPAQEVDAASMRSTSSFASTVSLLKANVKAKFHSNDKSARKGSEPVVYQEKTPSSREPSPKAQTAEAYRIMVTTKY